jgi:Starch binding domain
MSEQDFVTLARGDSGRLIDILTFLAQSSAHSIAVKPLSAIPPDAAEALKQAVSEDGYDANKDLKGGVCILHLVSGRVERDIILAHLSTEVVGSPSSIDYVVEGSVLVGRNYRNDKPDVIFLDYEIRTDSSDPVFLVGNTEYLGSWDPASAVPLQFTGAGPGGFHWSVRIPLRRGATIDFKFLKQLAVWEAGQNRTFTAGDQDVSTSDNFHDR